MTMPVTRHRRALQKIEAIKARKRFQTVSDEANEARNADPIKLSSPVVNKLKSQTEEDQQPVVHVVTPPRPESGDGDFEEAPQSSPDDNTYEDFDVKSSDIPAGEETSEAGDFVTPVTKILPRAEKSKEVTANFAQKRRDIVINEQRRTTSRSRKVSLKQSIRSKHHVPKSRMKSLHMRTKDDDSTVESGQDRRGQKSDGIAGALDPLFDFLMDEASVGDDSISVRTERTYEKGDIVKDVEDFIWDRMDCGKVSDVQEMDSRTFSMDESTVSDGLDTSKANKQSHRRTKSLNVPRPDAPRPRARVASEEISTIIPDDVEVIDACVRASWKILGDATTTFNTEDRDLTEGNSFDSREIKPMCSDLYQMASEMMEIDDTDAGSSKIDKFSQVVKNAKRQAEKVKMDFKSDASFPGSLQTSMKDTSSYASTFFSSLRESTTFTGTERSTEIMDSAVSSSPSGETHSVVPTSGNEKVEEENKPAVYAPAEDLKSDASFFSNNVGSDKKSSSSAFEEAIAKLKDTIDTTSASAKLQELQASIKGIKLVPDDSDWSANKFYEAFSRACNAEAHEGATEKEKEKQTIAEKVQTILACGPIEADVPFDEMEQSPKQEASLAQKIKNVLICFDGRVEDAVVIEEPPLSSDAPAATHAPPDQPDSAEVYSSSKEAPVVIVGNETVDAGLHPVETEVASSDSDSNILINPVKITVIGDPLESHSVGTPETTNSTEDEADEMPFDANAIEEIEAHFQRVAEDGPTKDEVIPEQEVLPEQEILPEPEMRPEQEAISEQEDFPDEPRRQIHKKWSPLRRVVAPLFRKKKQDEQPLVQVHIGGETHGTRCMSFDVPDSAKSTSTSPSSTSTDVSSENQATTTPIESTENPFDPSISGKSKREAWRSTRADDFDEIITKNARADDWDCMFPEFSDPVENATMASF
jgi:hypothetical protein